MIQSFLKILVIDDNPSNLYYLARNFENEGYFIRLAKSFKEAQYHFKEEFFDFIISRDVIHSENIDSFIRFTSKFNPHPEILIMCSSQDQYLNCPWFNSPNIHFLIIPIRFQDVQEILKSHIQKYQTLFVPIDLADYPEKYLVAASHSMKKLVSTIKKFASSKSTILLGGESGAGKEVIARLIHYYSPRRKKPFVAVNCSAIPENLLESELFGYERGAFTGANRTHKGLFEIASGGTIFLDEIGEMNASMQSKLLRVLELKEFYRVGSNQPLKSDIRIIAATNQNLEELVVHGKFRKDLLYRINVVHIEIPPLRERTEDISYLARYFLYQFVKEYQLPQKEFSRKAIELLEQYSWPGNVRELKNKVERLSFSVEGDLISADDIAEVFGLIPQSIQKEITIPLGSSLQFAEKEIIRATLQYCNYNRTKTAKMLGIGLRTLQRKLKKFNL